MKNILIVGSLFLGLMACNSTDAKTEEAPKVKTEVAKKKSEAVKSTVVKPNVQKQKALPTAKAPAEGKGIVWVTDVDKAFELSAKLDKPVFAFFTGKQWCGWCKKLVAQVFNQPEFIEYANKEYIMLELDFPRRDRSKITPEMIQMSQSLGVKGYPSVYLITKDKKVLGKTGYQRMDAKQYIAHLEAFRNK